MSSPLWWGDWRPTLTPHTGNLQATDLIECTSIVGGLPVNTAITGAQIIAAASGGATWGSITGTLSSQTDLQTALNGKQATLISATNIKTINGNSILGSGDLTVSGSNIYNANGTLTAARTLTQGGFDLTIAGTTSSRFFSNGNVGIGTTTNAGYKLDVNGTARVSGNLTFGSSTSYLYGDTNNIRLYDKNNRIILQCFPSGVLNSETFLTSGTSNSSILRLRDDYASIEFSNTNSSNTAQNPIQFIKGYFGNIGATDKSIVTIKSVSYSNLTNATLLRGLYIDINDTTTYTGFTTFRAIESKKGGAYFNTTSANSSAILQADSTTQGFLPPRMTNAQMLAIATPAAGLVVYDTTNNKHCGYNGTAWQNFY